MKAVRVKVDLNRPASLPKGRVNRRLLQARGGARLLPAHEDGCAGDGGVGGGAGLKLSSWLRFCDRLKQTRLIIAAVVCCRLAAAMIEPRESAVGRNGSRYTTPSGARSFSMRKSGCCGTGQTPVFCHLSHVF